MLRNVGWLFFVLAVQWMPGETAPLKVKVMSDAVVLMNPSNGAILYQKNPTKPYHPASITKIATALYAIKVKGNQLDELVTADQDAVSSITEEEKKRSNYSLPSYRLEPGGSHIGIKKGETLSLRALLNGMLIASGNDAANVIAQHVGGTIPAFVEQMNAYLKEIGCKQTVFYNPHGLHHPNHLTSAYDMALITKEAMNNPNFREIVSTVRFTRPKTNKQEATTLIQTNKLLRAGKLHYDKAIGVKTGYTSQSQNTFVAAAKDENGRVLIAVCLHCKEREDMFKDSVQLFEAAFNEKKVERTLLKAGEQRFSLDLTNANQPLKTYLKENAVISYYPAEEPTFKTTLAWEQLSLPVHKDQEVAKVNLTSPNGTVIKSIPLFAVDEVTVSFWSKFKVFLVWAAKIGLGIGVLFLIYRIVRRS
jgi:serine-type D-Ala-D-Ala carboxypeptidase (penicillin-binding protein 5/6)